MSNVLSFSAKSTWSQSSKWSVSQRWIVVILDLRCSLHLLCSQSTLVALVACQANGDLWFNHHHHHHHHHHPTIRCSHHLWCSHSPTLPFTPNLVWLHAHCRVQIAQKSEKNSIGICIHATRHLKETEEQIQTFINEVHFQSRRLTAH